MGARVAAIDFYLENGDLMRRLFAQAGIEVVEADARQGQDVQAAMRGARGVITSYGDFSARAIEALDPTVKVISRTGVGYDNIDVEAATRRGIAVCYVPGYATEVVSTHAIALALAVLRRIPQADRNVRAGKWSLGYLDPLGQVAGRTFGIVGFGAIGRATARKAAGLGFDVVVWSRSLEQAGAAAAPEGYRCLSLDDLLAASDVVSLHTALVPATRNLIDARRLAIMKPGAVLVNTARGGLVDANALTAVLEEGRLFGAGLDVFPEEPLDPASPLARAPRTVLTPHAAYQSQEAVRELCERSVQAVIDVVQGRAPADCLNPSVL